MKILCVSDMHGQIPDLSKYEADLFVDCGDFAPTGWRKDALVQMDWVNTVYLPYIKAIKARYKIILGGNHDGCSELPEFRDTLADLGILFGRHDSFEIEGKKIFATSWNFLPPEFERFGWCWGMAEEALDEFVYSEIPANLDLLITHCPPKGILDAGWGGDNILNCGSSALRKHVERVNFNTHIYGHEHYHGGMQVNIRSGRHYTGPTPVRKKFINAAQHVMEFEI